MCQAPGQIWGHNCQHDCKGSCTSGPSIYMQDVDGGWKNRERA